MIERGIVQIDDRRTTVRPPLPTVEKRMGTRRDNITSEQFFEEIVTRGPGIPDKIRAFLERLEPLGVYADYRRSLNLKWDPPSGKPINLGYILRDGQVWTDAAGWSAPQELSRRYQEELAAAVGAEVEKKKLDYWHIRIAGKAPKIEQVVEHFDKWREVIERFLDKLKERLAEDG